MGTNYYTHENDLCPHCGRGGDEIHIGKSSAGWVFMLAVYPDRGLNTLDDWKKYLHGKRVFDEYGKELTPEQMIDVITRRRGPHTESDKPFGYDSWAEFHEQNKSEFGPNNLLRLRSDAWGFVGHGEGTWDYSKAGFS